MAWSKEKYGTPNVSTIQMGTSHGLCAVGLVREKPRKNRFRNAKSVEVWSIIMTVAEKSRRARMETLSLSEAVSKSFTTLRGEVKILFFFFFFFFFCDHKL